MKVKPPSFTLDENKNLHYLHSQPSSCRHAAPTLGLPGKTDLYLGSAITSASSLSNYFAPQNLHLLTNRMKIQCKVSQFPFSFILASQVAHSSCLVYSKLTKHTQYSDEVNNVL